MSKMAKNDHFLDTSDVKSEQKWSSGTKPQSTLQKPFRIICKSGHVWTLKIRVGRAQKDSRIVLRRYPSSALFSQKCQKWPKRGPKTITFPGSWGPRGLYQVRRGPKITKITKMAKMAIFGLSGKVPKMAFFLVQEAEMSLCITPCEGVSRGVQKWDPFLVTFGGLKWPLFNPNPPFQPPKPEKGDFRGVSKMTPKMTLFQKCQKWPKWPLFGHPCDHGKGVQKWGQKWPQKWPLFGTP